MCILTFPYCTYSIIHSILSCSFPQVYNSSCTNTEMPTQQHTHICFCIFNVLGNLGICILFLLFLVFFGGAVLMPESFESMSSHRTCQNMKNSGEGHQAARISPSSLPICSATIIGCSISFQNKMPTFNLKLFRQGDDVPAHMLSIDVRSCDVCISFSWFLHWDVRLQLCPMRAGKGWREEVEELASGCWHSCCAGLISLRTLHAFCLY